VFWTTKFGQPSEPEPEPEPEFPNLKYPTKNPDIRPIRPKIAWHSPQDTPTLTPVPQRPQTHPRAQQWLFSIPANSLNFIKGLPAQPVAPSHRNSVGVPPPPRGVPLTHRTPHSTLYLPIPPGSTPTNALAPLPTHSTPTFNKFPQSQFRNPGEIAP
jgi:hypothetical protein